MMLKDFSKMFDPFHLYKAPKEQITGKKIEKIEKHFI